jgi:hypothetical protein
MSASALESIKAFVAGEITPLQFRDRLYGDPDFEGLLAKDPHLKQGNYAYPGVYYFLLEQDFEDPGGVLSVQGALTDFLDRNNIPYKKTSAYQELHWLILSAQPRWMYASPKFVCDHILPESGGRTGKELKKWLKGELLKRFRYVAKPPRWIQSPAWPVNGTRPLVFLGQLDVNDFFHDAAIVYVFYDPESGSSENIIQVF